MKPAKTPIRDPINKEINIARKPTANETLPPASIWAKVSCPMLSVPKGWDKDGPRFLSLKLMAFGSTS